MATSDAEALAKLVRIVVEDAEAECGRARDRAVNEARRLVQEAEDRIDALRVASRNLGRTRGEAARAAREQEADREIETVRAAAFDALAGRFRERVLMALRDLPKQDRYAQALAHWAEEAASRMDRPAEVLTSRRDRTGVYDALMAAAAEDFHVRVDHHVHVGFVVRDLDGRTILDRRPEALVEEYAQALRDLLASRVEPFEVRPAVEPGDE